jgi:quercetin dioxygenase-like cupin family protein
MTLKAMEGAAGVSATHVSEIERGRTSPTLGALARIAAALGKDVSFFLEEETLDEVCHLELESSSFEPLPFGGGLLRRLTHLLPGGRLCAYEIRLDEGAASEEHRHEGQEIHLIRQGRVRYCVDSVEHELAEGDSIHLRAEHPHRFVNLAEGTSRILLFTTRRHDL